MATETYPISGMHCGSCVAKITNALAPLAAHVTVTREPPQAVVVDAKVEFIELQAALSVFNKYALSAPQATQVEPLAREAARQSSVGVWLTTYKPLLLLLLFIAGASVLIPLGQGRLFSLHETMRYFMAGFFCAFSFFKLMGLTEFARAYARYDVLAKFWPTWGFAYPFVEALLGIGYLANIAPALTNGVTFALMTLASIGVIRAVATKSQIDCACLGGMLKLPMSTISIVENVGMAAMAGYALLARH
jgi:copper chaperone CopZ